LISSAKVFPDFSSDKDLRGGGGGIVKHEAGRMNRGRRQWFEVREGWRWKDTPSSDGYRYVSIVALFAV
jgi:hypothetical protein